MAVKAQPHSLTDLYFWAVICYNGTVQIVTRTIKYFYGSYTISDWAFSKHRIKKDQ